MRSLRRQVLTHDVDRWAAAFLSALERTRDHVADAMARLPGEVVAAIAEVSETERLLVATDFDGCLAPIVDDPATARPIPESMEALRSLTVTPGTVVAVVSGRALADLENLLGPAERMHLVGSHGAETSAEDRDDARRCPPEDAKRLGRLRLELQQITAEYRGRPAGAQADRHRRPPAGHGPGRCRGGHHADRGEPGDLAGGAPAARQDGARADRGDHQQGPRTRRP